MNTAVETKGKKNQQGFTLIEIIAVLVILGILAAVAIPKYQDLQATARLRGADGIVAGAMSSASLSYSSQLLNNDSAVLANIVADCQNTSVTGDYTLLCTGGTNNIAINVTHNTDSSATVEEIWNLPGT